MTPEQKRKVRTIVNRVVSTMLPNEPDKARLADRLSHTVVLHERQLPHAIVSGEKGKIALSLGGHAGGKSIRVYGFAPGEIAHETLHKIEGRLPTRMDKVGKFAYAIGFLFDHEELAQAEKETHFMQSAKSIEERVIKTEHESLKKHLGLEEFSSTATGLDEGTLMHGFLHRVQGAGIAVAARRLAREVRNPDAMWDYIRLRAHGKKPNEAWAEVKRAYSKKRA